MNEKTPSQAKTGQMLLPTGEGVRVRLTRQPSEAPDQPEKSRSLRARLREAQERRTPVEVDAWYVIEEVA